MVQPLPHGFRILPDDPRAPSQEEWDRMSPEERAAVVEALPSGKEQAERHAQVEAERAQIAVERVAALEKELAEARAEIERLKRGG